MNIYYTTAKYGEFFFFKKVISRKNCAHTHGHTASRAAATQPNAVSASSLHAEYSSTHSTTCQAYTIIRFKYLYSTCCADDTLLYYVLLLSSSVPQYRAHTFTKPRTRTTHWNKLWTNLSPCSQPTSIRYGSRRENHIIHEKNEWKVWKEGLGCLGQWVFLLLSQLMHRLESWECVDAFLCFRLFGRVYSTKSGNELSRDRNERFPHLAGATIFFFSLSPIPEYALAERSGKNCPQCTWVAACCMHIERSVRHRVLDALAPLSVPYSWNNTNAQCVRAVEERKRHHSPLVVCFYFFRCFKKYWSNCFLRPLPFFCQSFFVPDYLCCFSFPIHRESVCVWVRAHDIIRII